MSKPQPKLTSKVDKDGNYVFNQDEVNALLLWAIEVSRESADKKDNAAGPDNPATQDQ